MNHTPDTELARTKRSMMRYRAAAKRAATMAESCTAIAKADHAEKRLRLQRLNIFKAEDALNGSEPLTDELRALFPLTFNRPSEPTK